MTLLSPLKHLNQRLKSVDEYSFTPTPAPLPLDSWDTVKLQCWIDKVAAAHSTFPMDIDDKDAMDIDRVEYEGEITNLPPWPYGYTYEVNDSSGTTNIIIGPPSPRGLPDPLQPRLKSLFASKRHLRLKFHLLRGQYDMFEGFKCLGDALAWSLSAFKEKIASVDINLPQELDAHARQTPLRNLDLSWVPNWTYQIFQ
ncbi:hypothetical protein BDN72DRAFT_433422 [Pluteus cervinus]|uniref:Uncharacterized protein n=1 Tax=Pluteus cervinus TaxID=181527 RepID=A0ACD3B0Q1_9AGAR|nr:hypothetical protein BDN72DRAFT_433422 [Pluteus cervinus]